MSVGWDAVVDGTWLKVEMDPHKWNEHGSCAACGRTRAQVEDAAKDPVKHDATRKRCETMASLAWRRRRKIRDDRRYRRRG